MEREKKTTEEIRPLLLKIVIPLALPVAGFIISTLTTKSGTRRETPSISSSQEHQMASPVPNSLEIEHEERSHSIESSSLYHREEEEEEEEERVPLATLQSSSSLETTTVLCSENTRDVPVQVFHDGSNLAEEIEGLRCLVAALENNEYEFESQIRHYLSMREQESAFQKLQIMCLGLKLESLEAQNQRLEGAIMELRGATEELGVMKEGLRLLQKEVKNLSKVSRLHSRVLQRQALKLRDREAELSRSNDELKRATEEIKDLADQLQRERKETSEKFELGEPMDPSTSKSEEEMTMMEDNSIKILSDKKSLEQLEQARDQWRAELEELIYLGWISSCLRREMAMNQEAAAAAAEPVQDTADQVVAEFPASDCSDLAADLGEASVDVTARNRCPISRKPRLFHKLKGWAKGAEKSKRRL